jgi:hypothetical protein
MFVSEYRWRVVGILLFTVVAALAALLWNEARNEVVYLCGNFTEGVSERSVLTQLDTAELSEYRVMKTADGTRIEFDSALNLRLYKCVIQLNSDGVVVVAGVE